MELDFVRARAIELSPTRLAGWVARFGSHHGSYQILNEIHQLRLSCANSAQAIIHNYWAPFTGTQMAEFIAQLALPRRFALILVRKGADAVGVVDGSQLLAHRVTTHYVQGRTKAGGWSQQRFARRRANQADFAYQKAADDVFEVIVPHLASLEAVILGGDEPGLRQVLADRRLAKLTELISDRPILAVPEARYKVLQSAVDLAYQVRIELNEQACTKPGETDQPPAGKANS